MAYPTVLTPSLNTVFLTSTGLVLGTGQTNVGQFRFLKDYYNNGDYILAGEIRTMTAPWTPTWDVEPLDSDAVDAFYALGPSLGGVWRTHFTTMPISAPITYWKGIAPNLWQLTGLGASRPPISAIIERIEDKEP